MSDNKPFPCSGCGACCRRVNQAVANIGAKSVPEEHPLYFPYSWDEKGVCEKLVDNRCSVYENRPMMCDVEKVAEYLGIEREEFFKINARACNMLIDEDGLDESFKLKI